MIVFIVILVFSETQVGEAWEPPNKAMLFQTLECKVLSCGLIISFSWGLPEQSSLEPLTGGPCLPSL